MSKTSDAYEMDHRHHYDIRWRCTRCNHLICLGRRLPENADRVTGCELNVQIFPVKIDGSGCKFYERKQYSGYSY